jgi:hypothetical protein
MYVSYYLREMYLRKNLPFEGNPQNMIVFKDLNDPYLHTYLVSLMEGKYDLDVLFNHLATLD